MSVDPTHYDLRFEPHFENFTFQGNAKIWVWCYEKVHKISMHAAELRIHSCRVQADGRDLDATFRTNRSKETLTISVPEGVLGSCTIHILYTGTLNDRLLGFYRSRYSDGPDTKYLATTQFEAADARRAFPCWDEPGYKTTFDVTVSAPPGMEAISNMPARSVQESDGRTIHRFERTPPMSTYLLYLGVGEFETLEGGDDQRIRVVTTPGKSDKGRYALDIASKLLAAYEAYFDKPYPLPKLDLVALPDFAAGAMENWGAITFRENILLYDPDNSSTRTKQLIAEVVSHELAHQWFGNLVTMEWWNDLWLNESFATFMATKMVDHLHPEWDMWGQFLDDSMSRSMDLDALESTHPIDVEVKSPSQIREIFDAISYDKGGSILRMLEDYVGESAFKRGLRKYLRAFKYDNATGADLWDSIGWASKVPVEDLVESWLSREGFPVVDATAIGFQLHLKQERFYANGRKSRAKAWPIPIRFLDGKLERLGMFDTREADLGLPRRFVANHDRAGFYRVRYDRSLLEEIKGMVARKEIYPVDRWAVQNDLFAFCLAGRASVADYLDFIVAYADEDEYLPLVNVGRNLELLLNFSHSQSWAEPVRKSAEPFFSALLESLGWTPGEHDYHTDAFLRGMAISALGRLDDQVSSRAEALFHQFQESPASVHPDIRASVFGVAAHRGGARMHSRMKSMFSGADSIEEKLRILSGMCEFDSAAMLLRTLDFSLTDAVRSQNVHLPIVRVAHNPYGRGVLWPWLKDHWNDLEGKIGRGNPLFGRIVASISMAADGTEADDIREFLGAHPMPGTERTRAQMLEMVSIYANFRARAAGEAR